MIKEFSVFQKSKMLSLKKLKLLLFLLFYCCDLLSIKVKADTTRNNYSVVSIELHPIIDTLKESLTNVQDANKAGIYQYVSKDYIPLIATAVTIMIFIITLLLKRSDEVRDKRLKRLDKQLSDLYGPLFAWYEIGHANLESFRKSGRRFLFSDKEYRFWFKNVFLPTNVKMEEVIINNAELFEGKLPPECVKFCHHVAALKLCETELIKIENSQDNNKEKFKQFQILDDRIDQHEHPKYRFQIYIQAAFATIKREQEKYIYKRKNIFIFFLQLLDELNYLIYFITCIKFFRKKSLSEKIEETTDLQVLSLAIFDEIKERYASIPFNWESYYLNLLQEEKKKISKESMSLKKYQYKNGKVNFGKNKEITEEINFKNEKPFCIEFNRGKNKLLKIEYDPKTNNEQIIRIYKNVKSKEQTSTINHFYNNSNQLNSIQYFENEANPQYKIYFCYDSDQITECTKTDSNNNIVEYTKLNSSVGQHKHYRWLVEDKIILDWERYYSYNYLTEGTTLIGIVTRKDINPKTKTQYESNLKFYFDNEMVIRKIEKYGLNGEPEYQKLINYNFDKD